MTRETRHADARERQIERGLVTAYQVYNAVSRSPGLSVYKYSKMLGFTHGRTHGAIKRLEEQGLVRTEIKSINPHPKRVVVPTSARDLVRLFEKYDP